MLITASAFADLIYASGSRVNLSIFLIVSTNILFLLGSGLFSKVSSDIVVRCHSRGSTLTKRASITGRPLLSNQRLQQGRWC